MATQTTVQIGAKEMSIFRDCLFQGGVIGTLDGLELVIGGDNAELVREVTDAIIQSTSAEFDTLSTENAAALAVIAKGISDSDLIWALRSAMALRLEFSQSPEFDAVASRLERLRAELSAA